jgi:putative transposase
VTPIARYYLLLKASLRQAGLYQAGLYAVSHKKYKPKREKAEVTETKNLLLEQDHKPMAINQVWHSDITYVPTDEGWLYLAGVIDGFSKYLVG